jgi:hypothetical protein
MDGCNRGGRSTNSFSDLYLKEAEVGSRKTEGEVGRRKAEDRRRSRKSEVGGIGYRVSGIG